MHSSAWAHYSISSTITWLNLFSESWREMIFMELRLDGEIYGQILLEFPFPFLQYAFVSGYLYFIKISLATQKRSISNMIIIGLIITKTNTVNWGTLRWRLCNYYIPTKHHWNSLRIFECWKLFEKI